jgi:chromosomal replication initiator protein
MKKISLEEIWKTTLAQIEVKLDSPAHFQTWFIPTKLLEIQGKKALIGVKNSYACDWLQKKHFDLIKTTISHVSGTDLQPFFSVIKEVEHIEKKYTNQNHQEQASIINVSAGVDKDFEKTIVDANLNPSFTFKNFIVGPSNRLAQAACLAVCESLGKTYNPLFIYGDTGLGKTHLVHALGQKILEKSRSKTIIYTPSENFLNEMVNSIQTGKTRNFRNKFRFLDLLIIDDIQLISKWEQTQDELFNTFNALHNQKKQIVLISDRPPEKIHNLESRLKSRFQGGMVVQIERPDFETRLAIITQKTDELNINLQDHVKEFIAKNITSNIRQIEGSIQQIDLFNRINKNPITIEEIAKLMGADPESKREKTKPKDVIKVVAKEFQVTSKDILSRSRKSDIAFARQVVMYILREVYNYKLEEIASLTNRKDHTTIIHGVDKIKSKIQLEKGFEEQIQNIKSILN